MQIGFLGLGKMGSRMAEKLLREGYHVVVWNRSSGGVSNFQLQISNIKEKTNAEFATTIAELIGKLVKPRVVWLMLPAGEATEVVLQEVTEYLEAGDIVIDGGNAFYKDTELRYQKLKKKKIKFLGIGVSGGIVAFENGYPFMVGGDKTAFEHVKPVLESLTKPHGGYEYFGTGGAGHFVKMVHNGIEYSIMQGLGEGFGVMEQSPYNLDLSKVAKLYQKGTLVSGFMLDRAVDALEKNGKLDDIEGVIDATGEAAWTVKQGKEERVPVENIEQTLDFRRRSKNDKNVSSSFAARMVAALRREFGGHATKIKE